MIEGARCAHEPCGRPFTKNRTGQRYCTSQCQKAAQAARQAAQAQTRTCEQCGATFTTNSTRKRFCDDRCRAESQREQRRAREKRQRQRTRCSRCGGDLPAKPVQQLRATFCSWRCYLLRMPEDNPNHTAEDTAHVACLDLQQAAAHVPALPPITSPLEAWAQDGDGLPRLSDQRVAALMHDPDEADDDGVSMAAPEPAPIGSPFEDEYGRPMRTDWSL